jgi:hypothetical protein
MWCPSCKAEVAAEVAADNRRVRCATCGGEIPVPSSFPAMAKTREARELLDRWASERQPEPSGARSSHAGSRTVAARPLAGGGVSLEVDSHSSSRHDERGSRGDIAPSEEIASSRRLDSAQSLAGPAGIDPSRVPNLEHASVSPRVGNGLDSGRVHRIHGTEFGGPNFDVQASLLDTERRKTNWTYVLGQLLAYAGVALLTVGSTLVIWGYFGGPASYAPTGWLTTMAGQMILILGVVTLVSGGMEQTNEDVRVRIERLGERIIRIEHMARDHALRGPNFPADGRVPAVDSRQESEMRR